MSKYCPICNGILCEIDKFGTIEECELCGTTFTIKPKVRKDESKQ